MSTVSAHVSRVRLDGSIRAVRATIRGFLAATRPFADLAVRLLVAQAFFVSGILKLADFDNALYLAANEYPVPWLDPVTAAYLGVAIEVICPILLAMGLATRAAALPMMILTLVIQLSYHAGDTNLYWTAILGWYVVGGAGPLSLDALLRAGLAASPLPLVAPVSRILVWTTATLEPGYRLGLRLWLAAAVAGLIGAPMHGHPMGEGVPAALVAAFLALGLLTPPVALTAALAMAWAATGDLSGAAPFGIGLFVLLAVRGAGPLSADAAIGMALDRWLASRAADPARWPHVVIAGAGFGGMSCAVALRDLPVRVTVVDRHNYHLFQPLLYQVATASLSPGDIATPIRDQFRDHRNITVLMATVTGVDQARSELVMDDRRIGYDYLVLATGATHSYFGRDEWAHAAPGLKRVEDATAIRRRILGAFEQAEATGDPVERDRLLTFLIVGAGPTGVELAGAIAELARFGMERDYRNFDPSRARILLVQSGDRVLPVFAPGQSARAQASLEKLGIEVLTGSRVEGIDMDGVTVSGHRIRAGTVLWAAGVVASPAARWLGADADNAGRVKVEADLSVPGSPNVFVVGDTALSLAWSGQPVPGLAPAAKQGGKYAARVIRDRLEGRDSPPFRYRHLGSMATIGRKSAVASFGRLHLSGALAWWLWGLVHVFFLVGLRNRLSVMFDWMWAYLTFRGATRLITGEAGGPAAEMRYDAPAHRAERVGTRP